MKQTEAKSVGEIIDEGFRMTGMTDKVDIHRACYAWSEVVGPEVNRHTFKRYVDGTVLHVVITSAALKNELLFLKTNILKHINRAVGRDILTDLIIH